MTGIAVVAVEDLRPVQDVEEQKCHWINYSHGSIDFCSQLLATSLAQNVGNDELQHDCEDEEHHRDHPDVQQCHVGMPRHALPHCRKHGGCGE